MTYLTKKSFYISIYTTCVHRKNLCIVGITKLFYNTRVPI